MFLIEIFILFDESAYLHLSLGAIANHIKNIHFCWQSCFYFLARGSVKNLHIFLFHKNISFGKILDPGKQRIESVE
jgi:hypothetical protein